MRVKVGIVKVSMAVKLKLEIFGSKKIKSLTNEQTALTSKASSDEQKGKQKEKRFRSYL